MNGIFILCLTVIQAAAYSVCPWHVECIPGCVKLDQRGCKLCACGPMMFHPGAGYHGMPGAKLSTNGMTGGSSFKPGSLGGEGAYGSMMSNSHGGSSSHGTGNSSHGGGNSHGTGSSSHGRGSSGYHAVKPAEKPLKECTGTMLCMMTCKGHYSLSDHVDSNGCRACTCPKEHHEATQTVVRPNSQHTPPKPATHHDCTGTKLCMLTCKGKYILGNHGKDGCQSCACVPEPEVHLVPVPQPTAAPKPDCHETVMCMLSCKHGYKLTPKCNDGCHEECQKCTCLAPAVVNVVHVTAAPHTVDCPKTLQCMLSCKNGYQLGNHGTDGCPQCNCLSPPKTVVVLQVKCPQALSCRRGCTVGYKCDKNGCPTCECIPPKVIGVVTVTEVHTTSQLTCSAALTCPKSCSLGYKCGADGCPTCECCVAVHTVSITSAGPLNANGGSSATTMGSGNSGNSGNSGTSSSGSGNGSGLGRPLQQTNGGGAGSVSQLGNFNTVHQSTNGTSTNGGMSSPFNPGSSNSGTETGSGMGSNSETGQGPFSQVSGMGGDGMGNSGNGSTVQGPFSQAGNSSNGQGPFGSGLGNNWQSGSANGKGFANGGIGGPFANGNGSGSTSGIYHGHENHGNGMTPTSGNGNSGYNPGSSGGSQTSSAGGQPQTQTGAFGHTGANSGSPGATAPGSGNGGPFQMTGQTGGAASNNSGKPIMPFASAANGNSGSPFSQAVSNGGSSGNGASPFSQVTGNSGSSGGSSGGSPFKPSGLGSNGSRSGNGTATDGSGGNIEPNLGGYGTGPSVGNTVSGGSGSGPVPATETLIQERVTPTNCQTTFSCPHTCHHGYSCDTHGCPTCLCVVVATATHETTTTPNPPIRCEGSFSCPASCRHGYACGKDGCPACNCLQQVTNLKPAIVAVAPTPAPSTSGVSTLISKCHATVQCMANCEHGYTLGTEGRDGCPSCTCINVHTTQCHTKCDNKPAVALHTCDATLSCMSSCTDGYNLGNTGSDGCPACTCVTPSCHTGCKETTQQVLVPVVQTTSGSSCTSGKCETSCTGDCGSSGGHVVQIVTGGSTSSGGSSGSSIASGGGGSGGKVPSGAGTGGGQQCTPIPPDCHPYCIKYDVAHCRICQCEGRNTGSYN